ncbi:MAG TPA: tetratricopeptide repeat protein [Bryobacteraceae bacterium]|nr:tetratricopeptide repeat protein [Bryobacteraceae bacterium]
MALALTLGIAWANAIASGPAEWRERLNHGIELQKAGDLKTAQREFEASVELARKSSDDLPALGTALDYLSGFYDDIGEPGKAELTLDKSLAAWKKALGPDNIAIARVVQRMAALYIEKGEAERVGSLNLPYWIARLQAESPRSMELLRILEASASLESISHHFAQALELHRQAAAVIEALGGDDSDRAVELNDLGVVYLRSGNNENAIASLTRSLDLWSNSARDEGTFVMISQNLAEALTRASAIRKPKRFCILRCLSRSVPTVRRARGWPPF